MENKMQDSKKEEFKNRLVQLCVMAVINGTEKVVVDLPSLLNLYDSEISKAKREVLEKVALETRANICECGEKWKNSDLGMWIESELSKLTTK